MKKMATCFYTLVVCAFLLVPRSTHAQRERQVTVEKVQAALSALEKFVDETLQKMAVPGMAIAIVYHDQIVYLKGFGRREAGKNDPVTEDTVFQLASMSKPMASTVVASLVSAGVVSWDSRLSDIDPSFALYEPYVSREVTIRDFFAHRSGLPGNAGNDLEQIGYERAEILQRLRLIKPASSFRSTYSYSNFGITAGAVAAVKPIGKAWEDVAEERIYKPLGMTSTSSRYADFLAHRNRASLHVLVEGKWTPKFKRDPDAQSPAGGVSSTARDLAQWMRLELANGKYDGKQLIKDEAITQTHLPLILRGTDPATGKASFYGLGWNVGYDDQGRVRWGHAGAFSLGGRTVVNLLPSEQLGIVVLANAFPTGVPEGVADTFFDLVFAGKPQKDWVEFWDKIYGSLFAEQVAAAQVYGKPPASPSPALPVSAYMGTYTNDYVGNVEVVEKRSTLELQLGPKKIAFPLKHFDRDVFIYTPYAELPTLPCAVTFTIGPDQKATQVAIEDWQDTGQGVLTRVR